RAGRSPLDTVPFGTAVSPLALPLKALQSWRARSIEDAVLKTRMRSARYCWKPLRSSGVRSRLNRVSEPPEIKTAFVLLTTRETPEERRSGGAGENGRSVWPGNAAPGDVLPGDAGPRAGLWPGDPEDAGRGAEFNGSDETDVCLGLGDQLASTRFIMRRSRAARRISSGDIDWIHSIPSSRRTRIS